MPLNTLRLNHQPSSHPNHLITFIKPLPRPPQSAHLYEHAQTFLQAIAAQCLPIMKKNHLSVTTLEEHEPNREFIGRNFNNGEVIQLVLRSQDNTRWLPVNVVQMVMMHELAHNQQMNHSRKFWEVRNGFVQELRQLWNQRFTGEGFWGGGRVLGDLEGQLRCGDGMIGSDEIKDLQICGGTFRSRRTKRRRRGGGGQDQELTWREKRDRRIEKKFGKNGVSLGEDEDKRLSLEIQRKGPIGGKPRVAQSKRGRELRAAAALARFETNKKEVNGLNGLKKEAGGNEDEDILSDSEYEYEEVDIDADQEDAKDIDGQRILDNKGNGLIRIYGDDDEDNIDIKQEMDDFEDLSHYNFHDDKSAYEPPNQFSQGRNMHTRIDDQAISRTINSISACNAPTSSQIKEASHSKVQTTTSDKPGNPSPPQSNPVTIDPSKSLPPNNPKPQAPHSSSNSSTHKATTITTSTTSTTTPPLFLPTPEQNLNPTPTKTSTTCPICSLTNSIYNPTCLACSHVLNPKTDTRSWKCSNLTCRETTPAYTNAGDVVICGVCGERRKKLT